MGLYSMALKGLLNPVIKEKAKLTYEQREVLSEYWILVIPFLRLFFQGVIDDDKSKDFLKALAQCDKKTFREVTTLLVIWFFYNLDRTVLRGVNDLLEEQKIRTYLIRIWFIDPVEFHDIVDSLDNARIEERQEVFCKLVCGKLSDGNLLSTLMIFASIHMFGSLKLVLSLNQEKLESLSL